MKKKQYLQKPTETFNLNLSSYVLSEIMTHYKMTFNTTTGIIEYSDYIPCGKLLEKDNKLYFFCQGFTEEEYNIGIHLLNGFNKIPFAYDTRRQMGGKYKMYGLRSTLKPKIKDDAGELYTSMMKSTPYSNPQYFLDKISFSSNTMSFSCRQINDLFILIIANGDLLLIQKQPI